MTEKTIGLAELNKEKTKLEGDRSMLGERLQALNVEREKSQQQLVMTAGALQTINHFIDMASSNEVEPEEVVIDTETLSDK
jgi:hypothetical protein